MKKRIPVLLLAAALLAGCAAGAPAESAESSPLAPTSLVATEAAQHDDTTEAAPAGALVYESVELLHYTGEGAHPYVHSVIRNNTDKGMADAQLAMLAFDDEGNPLEIKWVSTSLDAEPSYYFLCDWTTLSLAPGEVHDAHGGWSLNYFGDDNAVDSLAYVLYCYKQITFEDGTVWDNPAFDAWRAAYEGQQVNVATLEGYYPFVQDIGL